MKDSPCDDKCPVYAMCQHRDAVQKYEICPRFRQRVISAINKSQEETDKKEGKGRMTVVGVRLGGKGPMINKSGCKISD